MASVAVDTLSIARSLREAKVPSGQAEAIADAIGRSLTESAASKADLRELEARIESKLENLKSTMMLWFIGTNLTLTAIIIAAIKF